MEILERDHGISGELKKSAIENSGSMHLSLVSFGVRYSIDVDKAGIAKVNEHRLSFPGFLEKMHITAGFDSENSAQNAWGVLGYTTGFFMVGLLVSGIMMWTYRSKERKVGKQFLGYSLLYCLVVLAVIRFG
jgi:hypothetical protein